MATFDRTTYRDLVVERTAAQDRLVRQHDDGPAAFDVIVVGSGMGGGLLADELAGRFAARQRGRALVIEAGSYLLPTHVYNVSRLPNADIARRFAVTTFTQPGGESDKHYIHERPQLNLGGRSIFWSGLIPTLQQWELDFFPPAVRQALAERLEAAGARLNASVSLGRTAAALTERLRAGPMAEDFDIRETPRALHQPYLSADGSPRDEFWTEPTGVFNTAELLVNQAAARAEPDAPGLHLRLNHYVETVARQADGTWRLTATDSLTGASRTFTAPTVVLAAGALETPKILRRSPVFDQLAPGAGELVGRGLTDHPTTDSVEGLVTHLGDLALPRHSHAKILFSSKGRRDDRGRIRYPCNIEMNLNHEYWHRRENDPGHPQVPIGSGDESIVDIKFSFGNPLDDANRIDVAGPGGGYVPEVRFLNLHWMDHLAGSRFPALAGWERSFDEIWAVLNDLSRQVFGQFRRHGQPAAPNGRYGEGERDFGYGTVHHAVGTVRMPARERVDGPFAATSVLDEDLAVRDCPGLFVCDLSALPFSSAANPVRTLAALALRLADHLTPPG